MIQEINKLEKLIAWSLLFLSIVAAVHIESYFITLLQSFAFQTMCVAAAMMIYWFLKKRWLYSFFAIASVLMLNMLVPPIFTMTDCEAQAGSKIRIAHFNVLKYNTRYQRIVDSAINSDADFISFQEVNTRWADSLAEGLCTKYPFYELLPMDNSTLGMAIFSKYPLCDTRVVSIDNTPNIAGDIQMEDTAIHFIASHTRAPVTSWNFRKRNRQIRDIANYLNTIEGPKIAVGDYNTVPWDYILTEFKNDTNLSDSRKSFAPTFPSYMMLLGIPIDYIFHCNRLRCLSFSTISNTSSDHLGVLGEYELKSYYESKNDPSRAHGG